MTARRRWRCCAGKQGVAPPDNAGIKFCAAILVDSGTAADLPPAVTSPVLHLGLNRARWRTPAR
jgi:hypothetical protein